MYLLGPWQTPQTMFWRRASPKYHCPGCSRVWRRASSNALRWGVSAGVDCPHQQNVKINVFWRLSLMLPVFWITEYASSIAPVVLSGVESVACIGNNSIHPLNLLWCIQGHFFGFPGNPFFSLFHGHFSCRGCLNHGFPMGPYCPIALSNTVLHFCSTCNIELNGRPASSDISSLHQQTLGPNEATPLERLWRNQILEQIEKSTQLHPAINNHMFFLYLLPWRASKLPIDTPAIQLRGHLVFWYGAETCMTHTVNKMDFEDARLQNSF